MAKVGEGDPRWVVQSRDDGKNVNNWHWSETDCLAWSKKYLISLLSDLSIFDDEQGYIKTKEVSSVTGECTANVRKGKTIFFYEIEVKVPWEAKLSSNEDTVKGQFTIPYISEEHDDDKMEVKVSGDSEGPAYDRLKPLLQSKGIPFIQKKVAEFLHALREEYTVKHSPSTAHEQPKLPAFQHKTPPTEHAKQQPSSKPLKSSITTKTIKLKDEFRGSAKDVYNSMIDPNMLNAIMHGGAVMNPTEKGTFSLLAGAITGENIKLVPGQKIVQKWRFSSWPEGHYSVVTIDLVEDEGTTALSLTQEGVPYDDVDRTEEGWRQNIWGRAKNMFGFGSVLF